MTGWIDYGGIQVRYDGIRAVGNQRRRPGFEKVLFRKERSNE